MTGSRLKTGIMLIAGCSLMALNACGQHLPEFIHVPVGADTRSPTPGPAAAPSGTITAAPSSTPTPAIPEHWTEVSPGMELRVMQVDIRDVPEPANAIVVRVDPEFFTFQVRYDPVGAATVRGWQERTGSILAVNGGFFESNNAPAGLLVADGEVFGTSFDQLNAPYDDYGGMFTVVGDAIGIRLLAEVPYQPDEPLDQAMQGFPMLVTSGGRPVDFDLPGETARRTAVALDQSERVIFIIIDSAEISLSGLRDWLAAADELAISAALNLDGGPSAGMALAAGSWVVQRDSLTRVPSVIEAIPR